MGDTVTTAKWNPKHPQAATPTTTEIIETPERARQNHLNIEEKKTPNYTNSNDDSNSSNPIARLKPTKRKKVSEKSDTKLDNKHYLEKKNYNDFSDIDSNGEIIQATKK